ncbi:MAG TPA: DUF3054 domain-containing protein [Pseudonocardiaceae bacterium]|nr:DUF3054 domain-containing protein [Pseudonocardiaceae bacterium]
MKRPAILTGAAVVADLAAVLVFAAAGRRTHAHPEALLGLLSTAGPFLVGLAASWLLARAWRRPLDLRTGLVVWPVTVVVGLAVRAGFTGRLPLSFAVVVVVVLGLLLLGWRAAVAVARVLPDRGGARPA